MSRRTLSTDERELWDSVAKQAKPLKKSRKAAATPSPLPPGERSTPKVSGEGALHRTKKSPLTPTLSPKRAFTPVFDGLWGRGGAPRVVAGEPPLLTHFDRRERAKIAKGRREIDARIDLHGMTQARAHRALLTFLRRESDNGARVALVITGKGKATSPDAPRGVLRRLVPEWLALPEFRAFVVSFEEAAIGHGGEGALYVRIRRGH